MECCESSNFGFAKLLLYDALNYATARVVTCVAVLFDVDDLRVTKSKQLIYLNNSIAIDTMIFYSCSIIHPLQMVDLLPL